MRISLDFDDTYSRDPDLWDSFIESCKQRNHEVYGITMRYPREGFGEIFERYKEAVG